jgi:HK97 family phage major capsid protein
MADEIKIDKAQFDQFSEKMKTEIEEIRKGMDAKQDVSGLEDKLTDLKENVITGLFKSKEFETMQGQMDSLATELKQYKEVSGKSRVNPLMETLKSDDYKNAIKAAKSNGRFDYKAAVTLTETNTITDDTTNNTRVIVEDRDPGVLMAPRPRLAVYDLVSKSPTDSRVIQYTERISETDGSSMIGTDGSAGGKGDVKWKSNSVDLTAIAEYIKVHRDMLEDLPVVQAEINEVLNFHIAAKRNKQILTGTGASNQLKGLIGSDPWAQPFSAPSNTGGEVSNANRYDAIRIAILQVQLGENTDYRTGFQPNAIVMHPTDAALFDVEKINDASYLLVPFTSQNGMVIKGVPIVEDVYMTEGSFLVGDFRFANARIRRGIEIRMYEQNEDDALNNLVTFNVTHRLGFYVKTHHQYAFVYGTFDNAISEINKVTG